MLVSKSSNWYYYSYSVYLTMWAVAALLLLLSCQCCQAGTLIQKIHVSGTVKLDESKLLAYIDYQIAKGFSKMEKDKDKGTKGVVSKLESDYVGCYYDDGNRLLKHRGKILQDNSIENCRKHCNGFKYIGLQHHEWCFCGNTLDLKHYPKKPEKDCHMPCKGNTRQICGAAGRNSIYYQKGKTIPVLLKTEKDDYVGCYLDDSNRLLKQRGGTLKDNSIESCRKYCTGFKFIGLQYSAQCFCGNTLDPIHYRKKPEKNCNMPCTGNAQQMCGGSWRNSIFYQNVDYIGCYLDDRKRLLKYRFEALQDNSLESCRKHCIGFKYLGLQYKNQCYCGDTLDPEKYPLKPERECQMPCKGKRRQKCGGSWRNSIYHV